MTDGLVSVRSDGEMLVLAEAPRADQNPVLVYLDTLDKTGDRLGARQALDIIAALVTRGQANALTFDWTAIRAQHVEFVCACLCEAYSPAVVNRMLSALQHMLEVAHQLGQISTEDYQAIAEIKSASPKKPSCRRVLGVSEIEALVAACEDDPSPAGDRDMALLTLLYGRGLQRPEVIALDLDDYHVETRRLVVARRTHNRGQRAIKMTYDGASTIDNWLQVRGVDSGALFWPVNKSGKLISCRITSYAIYCALRRRARHANVQEFTSGDLYRTFQSHLRKSGHGTLGAALT